MPSSRWTPIIAVVALFGAHDTALAQGVARAGDLTLRVDGKPATIKRATLDSMPQKTIRLGAGPDSGEVSGVDLWQVLQYARAVSDQASGRQRAVMYLRVTGSDNASAVIALVEVDPSFSTRRTLLVSKRNGAPLDATEGPWRLILPEDTRHARWIRNVVSISVETLK
jgi:hypothetical protein